MTRSQRLQIIAAAGVVLVFAVLLAMWTWALFLESPWLSYRNLPFPVQQIRVRAGDVVPLLVHRCNDGDSERIYLTTHSLERIADRQYVILPPVQVSIAPGCTVGVSQINRVPADTPAGVYRVIGSAQVRGMIREHQVDWRSQTFAVEAPR